jgi:hypothetical protein
MHDEMRIGRKKLMELVKKQQQKLEVTINFLCSTVKYCCWGKFMNCGTILRGILKKFIRNGMEILLGQNCEFIKARVHEQTQQSKCKRCKFVSAFHFSCFY